ncbi:MAG TPA: hypothetical protein VFM98_18380 [Ramlibacter sp.]|uniref:hypothetical protein n=1 Tax=Ramlibacter sp. TaxID=1917967 RepID=UPI002D7ED39E|nr:hypothetical protein [Ramlibacter sp.]HET8747572.1 hypothetical protein [Ramlibacter sp.]
MNTTNRDPTGGGPDAAVDIRTSACESVPSADDERRMADLGIDRDGLDYVYKAYRYEKLADAIAYAQLVRSRGLEAAEVFPSPRRSKPFVPPSATDQVLMASLGVRFDGRQFRFGGFRYDRLPDAVNYARQAASASSEG